MSTPKLIEASKEALKWLKQLSRFVPYYIIEHLEDAISEAERQVTQDD